MQVSHVEDLASHNGPESCAATGNRVHCARFAIKSYAYGTARSDAGAINAVNLGANESVGEERAPESANHASLSGAAAVG